MLVLAFDTSTSAVAVAIVQGDGTIRAERVVVEANRHGELLAPLIRDALHDAAAGPSDLSAIGVGLGPGAFTGLRVGIVTAKAMADALGIPAYGVCSLDLIAARHVNVGGSYAVMSDARRKQVYWAVYSEAGERLEDPELGRPDAVADLLRGRATFIAGAGAQIHREAFAGFEILERGEYPSAIDLGRRVTASVAAGQATKALVPLYLRRPDAQPPGPPKQVTPA